MLGHDQLQRPIRVLLCPDQPDWAFDNISKNIARYASGPVEFQKIYLADCIESPQILFEHILIEGIDVCHVFWREDLFFIFEPATLVRAAEKMLLSPAELVSALRTCIFTTSVYDHLHCSADAFQQRRGSYCLIDGYTVSSNKLMAIYGNASEIPPPDAVITDGVDIYNFQPAGPGKVRGVASVIGWVGNSGWGKSVAADIKGFHGLFTPVLNLLRTRGRHIDVKVADPQIRRLPFTEMPDFYRGLDILICTSQMEGTPNPVLEAMASGIPVISTDVGIVPDVFGPLQARFIVNQADPVRMADKVEELLFTKGLPAAIAAENRIQAQRYSWEITAKAWVPFWMAALEKSRDNRFSGRREAALMAQCNAEMWSRH